MIFSTKSKLAVLLFSFGVAFTCQSQETSTPQTAGAAEPPNASAEIDQEVSKLKKQLNTCRSAYKKQGANAKAQLEKAKATDVMSVPELSEKLQKELNAKAEECKEIKGEIEFIEKNRAQFLAIDNAPSEPQVGPTIRCFHLGQNWKEFSACAVSLGYKPLLALKQNFVTIFPISPPQTADLASVFLSLTGSGVAMKAFEDRAPMFLGDIDIFRAGPVTAVLDKNRTVQMLFIGNPEFFGTAAYNENFLKELRKNYNIPRLEPFPIDMGTMLATGYKYEGDGWGIRLSDSPYARFLAFYKTGSSKKDYTF